MNFRLRIVVVAPRIAANVGNIARTARALNAELHLVQPFGFIWDEKKAKRASVGYWEDLAPILYRDASDFWQRFPHTSETQFVFAEKDGEKLHFEMKYRNDCVLIFGNEEEGVDPYFWKHQSLPPISSCRIPMHKVRCLNVATSAGIVSYEVIRQWNERGYNLEAPLIPASGEASIVESDNRKRSAD